MKKLLFISLFLAACETPTENARELPGRFVYLKDRATNLCFVYVQYGDSNQGMLTNVPCSEQVEKKLVNPLEKD